MNLYQEFIAKSRYCRWLEKEGRRESWEEAVARYFDFFKEHLKERCNYDVPDDELAELKCGFTNLEYVGSMRALMTAGPALKRDETAGYNCSYVSPRKAKAFDELLFILMCGVGAGFTCERQVISELPTIPEELYPTDSVIVIRDSKIGWAKAVKEVIGMLYSGTIPNADYSKLRKAGERLKTFGGRSSGPEPLRELVDFIIKTFKEARGRKLTSLEVHDIMCFAAQVVVVGGVRRSALISLSNLSDERMRNAKSGQWWVTTPHRALANNSVAYTEKPDMQTFMREWLSLYESKSGERGIFNRQAAKKQVERSNKLRKEWFGDTTSLRSVDYDFGCNPCSEIILRENEFCNLTEVIVRSEDTLDTLKAKIRAAVILGTWQSTLTNFRYLSPEWKKNCEEERLLGVSLTGVMGHYVLSGRADNFDVTSDNSLLAEWLLELRRYAIEVNKEYAEKLGINQSVAITANKPSGTVSQLANCSSGIHPWHNDYYIRTVRGDNKDPITQFMKANGFPYEQDYMNAGNTVFSFPIKSDDGAVLRNELTAVQMLEVWLAYQRYYCEHKPSVTVNVRDHEWMEVGAWVYEHFDECSGVSFLPYSDHVYRQAPYQDCTKEQYEELLAKMPTEINWDDVKFYELEDGTTGSQELACTAGVCEIVDLTH